MKDVATGIVAAALGSASAGAQEAERRRVAPPAVYQVAPGLGHFTDDVLFGEVWERPDMTPRDRSLVTIAGLIAMGRTAQIGSHVARGLDNGLEPAVIGETITHLAFYTGWPTTISAVAEVAPVFEARGIVLPGSSDAARIEPAPAAEAARRRTVDATVAPTAPALADLTDRVLFGDLWRRPDMSARDRSLVTMAALVAIGQPEQLPFHANRAMDNGLTRAEAAEVVMHLGFYAGWPRAMSAVPVLERVFAVREAAASAAAADLRLVPATPGEGSAGSADYFTGKVTISGPYSGTAPARIGGATVSFDPGARTAWHSHPLGQTLFILSGTAWVQKEGGPVIAAKPGDVVWIPPMVKHWHGATPEAAMRHFAIAEALNGSVVTWMEQVPDELYQVGPVSD